MLLKMFSPAYYTISTVMYMDNIQDKYSDTWDGQGKDIHQSLYKYRIYMCIGTNLITLLDTGQLFLFLCN